MSTSTAPKESQLLKADPRKILPSPYQSRKLFDPGKLEEMKQSIRENGIIQPPVVRLNAAGEQELVVGERRLRASVALELQEIKILLIDVTDAQAEGMVLTENIQREGLTPAEEAHAFERLLSLRGDDQALLYTRAKIAEMISKDDDYVTARLKLLLCPEDLVAAVNEGRVSVSTAMLVGRIPDAKARAACAALVLKPEIQEVSLNYAQTRDLVRDRFMVKLTKAEFDLEDTTLVPVKLEAGERCQGGACADCPFRSGNLEGVQLSTPEIRSGGAKGAAKGSSGGADAWLCTLPRCHKLKLDAAWRLKREKAAADGGKVIDEKEAKKVFSGREGKVAYDSKLAAVDEESYIDGVGFLKPRSVLKGPEAPKIVLAQHPETGKVVELVDKAELKVFVQKRANQVSAKDAEAEKREEEDRKKRRAAEIQKEKIDKLALKEGLIDIMEHIGRKGAEASLLAKFTKLALDRAGSDGVRFLMKHLEIPVDEKKKSWERKDDESILKHAQERCGEGVHAWNGMLALVLMSWSVSFNGLGSEAFKLLAKECGVDISKLQQRAKVMLEAEKKSKPGKETKPAKAAKDHTDPTHIDSAKEASKTAAADKRHKKKVKEEAGLSATAKGETSFVRQVKDYCCDECGCALDVPFGKGDEAARLPKGAMKCTNHEGKWMPMPVLDIVASKVGKAAGWTPADVEEGAELLKQNKVNMVTLIGSKPDRTKDSIAYKNWNGLRMKLLRKAGLQK